MKKPLHPVSDHAVLRYLERVEGVDVEAIRRTIGRRVDRAVEMGASGAICGGFVYKLCGGVVVTVRAHHAPDRRLGRTGGAADE